MRCLRLSRYSSFVSTLFVVACCCVPAAAQSDFVRGDCNDDGSFNIADPVYTLNYLFNSGPSNCLAAMDGNDDESVNVADAVSFLTHLFGGTGTFPPAPHPNCGPDPTVGTLSCIGPVTNCVATCTDDSQCATGEYCQNAVGDCTGSGTCVVVPLVCPAHFDPVCGCDGTTYGNICEAAMFSANVEHLGACLGCTDNSACAAGEYCEKQVGFCGSTGNCVTMPTICIAIFDPVCGCDGQTYGNACEAAAAGVNVASAGVCPCSSNTQCPSGTYCERSTGNCAGIGLCEPIPMLCTAIFAPVCGCDGQTYGNACNAAMAGVSLLHVGACAGCTLNTQCAAGEYCSKNPSDCNGSGSCQIMPMFCPAVFDPVCGCDGQTYGNSCEAAAAGINVDYAGPC
ncbi:MAG: Kazal-type serine protease inhibitor domain-containing protein [Planctomycetota bacterium]